MRISDCSSDVCSSDLVDRRETGARPRGPEEERIPAVVVLGQHRYPVARCDPRGEQRVRDAVRSGVEFGEAGLARAEFHRDRTAAPARLRRRNIGQCPDGFQIDHFALPPTVSLEINRLLSKYWPAQKFDKNGRTSRRER